MDLDRLEESREEFFFRLNVVDKVKFSKSLKAMEGAKNGQKNGGENQATSSKTGKLQIQTQNNKRGKSSVQASPRSARRK